MNGKSLLNATDVASLKHCRFSFNLCEQC